MQNKKSAKIHLTFGNENELMIAIERMYEKTRKY